MNIYIMQTAAIGPFVADQFQELLALTPDAVIGLTTGNTPLTTGIYKELVRREREDGMDLQSCVFVNPDEQIGITREHPESYSTYMNRHFFDSITHPLEKRFIPDGMAEDPQAECERMERFIEQSGGIDYQLIGLGINGHICFIEPAPSLPSRSFVTPIAPVNRELYAPLFGSVDAVPTHAVTFGWGTVMRSRKLCLVAVGEGKAEIVAQALLGRVTTELPATLVQLHPNVDIVLDSAAAKVLEAHCESGNNPPINIRYIT
ncbi:glucosamine-6-phosphate deaminase [Paenibacillus nasutitermitis]|uniref:Glucosamine-6-phosphate deaminase n=1 Tax=Paenibacillus nasutitermitis TaxID=1652958 RepID=A0A916ZGP1_9BACL|nr:glucosamine-6-phosphate deaminase [Paenibacillus nasutitermitis]GGD97207.1 glucosamine-6-phosphate deaminase [Paenibacillus nasutitermitis]